MHGLWSKSLMHCSIASVRLNNVSSPFLLPLSNLASLRVSYQRLLQTIGVLEAQRTQAILDLETLARQQREALANPISFVEQLQKRVTDLCPCVLTTLTVLLNQFLLTLFLLKGHCLPHYVNGKDNIFLNASVYNVVSTTPSLTLCVISI